jgi:hypothetical protein
MVCPNCHSDRIIAVQDQHFCINCGLQVPDSAASKGKTTEVAVGENGLPEGIKILPITPAGKDAPPLDRGAPPDPKPTPEPKAAPVPGVATAAPLIKQRSRITPAAEPTEETPAGTEGAPNPTAAAAKAKKRKPGRPKAGRLDVPKVTVASTTAVSAAASAAAPPPTMMPPTAPATPVAPSAARAKPPVPTPPPAPTGPRRLSDIAPRRTPHHARHAAATTTPPTTPAKAPAKAPETPDRPAGNNSKKIFKFTLRASRPRSGRAKSHVHKVGVPPLHYGQVLAFSLRARVRGHWLLLGTLTAASLAAAVGYLAWLYLNGGLPRIATAIAQASPTVIGEVALLAVLYYIGRGIGQGAIIYGITREADSRPAPLSHQLGVGINTFGRRLTLDLGVGLLELALIALGAELVIRGGGGWPVNPQLQVAALFAAFLVLLYLLTGLALARGLAGVAVTITAKSPLAAAKLGWQLFNHRLELITLRFVAGILELILAAPLAAIALALILTVPAAWHIPVAIATGLLAWLAGALFGAGTAAWWTALYRRIVTADRPSESGTLLAGYNAESPRPGALTVVVAASSFLITAALALPWLRFF